MNKEFDFDDIGKQMPYGTPETFFEDNRREILKHTCGEEHKRNRFRVIVPAILVVAALLAGILFMPLSHEKSDIPDVPSTFILMAGTESGNSEVMDHFIESLSDEELQELAELSETDIFLF
jgi:hypothetical protein